MTQNFKNCNHKYIFKLYPPIYVEKHKDPIFNLYFKYYIPLFIWIYNYIK